MIGDNDRLRFNFSYPSTGEQVPVQPSKSVHHSPG